MNSLTQALTAMGMLLALPAFLQARIPLLPSPERPMAVPVDLRGVSPIMETPARLVLEKQLALSGDEVVSAPLADDLAFFLQQRYLEAGYRNVRVDWKLSGPRAVLIVQEGKRLTVGEITFNGVDASRHEVLSGYLTRQTREREGRLAKELPFVEKDLTAGVSYVVRRLQADGHLRAKAEDPIYNTAQGSGETSITLNLVPGPLYVFDRVTVTGNPAPLSKEAVKKIEELADDPFSEVRLENVRKELKGDLQQQGYFAAETSAVAAPLGETGGPVPTTLIVQPGELFTVTEVRVNPALGRGARRVAESVFDAATGATYAPESLDLLHRRSLDTGIYSRLDVVPVATSNNTLALTIEGEEAKPKTLGFFAGYETFYGPIVGLEARHVNVFDSGRSLGLRAELRGTGSSGSLQLTDPAVFGSRNALNLGGQVETFTFKDYTRNSAALRGSLIRRFNRRITAELFAEFSLNEAESDVLTPDELGPAEYTTQTAGGKVTVDYRDNPLNPRSGWLAGIELEGGGFESDEDSQGNEDREGMNFVRTDLNASWYYPISERWRFAVGGRASAIRTSGRVEDLPIDLRVFNGGATTVRSFAERELGPESDKGSTPLGGLAATVMNAELSYKIIPNLEVAGFVDAGSLSRDESSLFSTDEIRYAIGMGLRYQLPVGPLRVDYGFNPDRKEGEKAGALHVTFGFAF